MFHLWIIYYVTIFYPNNEKYVHESLPSKLKKMFLKSITTMSKMYQCHNVSNVNNVQVTMSVIFTFFLKNKFNSGFWHINFMKKQKKALKQNYCTLFNFNIYKTQYATKLAILFIVVS